MIKEIIKEKVKINKASIEDISSIIKLINELFIEENKYYDKPIRVYKTPLKTKNQILAKRLQKQIKSSKTFIYVAKIENKVVGYIEGNYSQENTTFVNKIIGRFNNIVVTKNMRGHGISKLLYLELKKWFKINNCEIEELDVLVKNPAKKIYEKWGYKPVYVDMRKPIR
jgi:GNAT superfamily N-acetyltransferase